jgi:hypothetical protein
LAQDSASLLFFSARTISAVVRQGQLVEIGLKKGEFILCRYPESSRLLFQIAALSSVIPISITRFGTSRRIDAI